MTLAAGTRLGPYELVVPIGSGGMGEVYKARDTRLGRIVAVKILSGDLAESERGRLRFLREARTISALNHPHICTLFDVGPDYLVMEYCEGVTLDARISATGSLPLDDVLKYGMEIADALDKAHQQRIIHRDLKPSNIMVTKSGLKLLDFGLAKQHLDTSVNQSTEQRITGEATIIGTAQYMAPEVLRGQEADARSDLFALGLVLYQMRTGKPAFIGGSRADLIAAILQREPTPVEPPELDRLIRACLAKHPDDRIQTAHDVKLQLQWIRDQISTPSFDRSQVVIPRRLWLSVAIAIAILVIAAGAIYVAHRVRASRTPIDSVAVLPFANVTRDPDAQYLSDGVSEMLINNLSEINSLRVIPRASAFRFKGDPDFHQAAKELRVAAIVTGRILRRGNDLNIQAELIDVADDRQLWGGQYERRMTDLPSIEGEISTDIAEHLRLRLSPEERERVSAPGSTSSAAYEAYLRGLYLWNTRDVEEMKKSLGFFEQAIRDDPAYAVAYAGLADAYAVLASHNWGVLPPDAAMPQAKAAAIRALQIDSSLAEAHTALGWVLAQYDWNLAAGEAELRRAIALKPNYPTAHYWLAIILSEEQRHNQAIAEIRKAHDLDPLSVAINTTGIGMVDYLARRYADAEQQQISVSAISPYVSSEILGLIYEATGRPERAVVELQKTVTHDPRDVLDRALLASAYARAGKRREATALLDGVLAASRQRYLPPHLIAIVYGDLGERDAGFAYLNKSFDERSSAMMVLRIDPRFDSLRSDPRFAEILRRVDDAVR